METEFEEKNIKVTSKINFKYVNLSSLGLREVMYL